MSIALSHDNFSPMSASQSSNKPLLHSQWYSYWMFQPTWLTQKELIPQYVLRLEKVLNIIYIIFDKYELFLRFILTPVWM